MQASIILSVTLIAFILLTSLPGLRGWRTSITSRGNASIFVILPMIMPFLGSTEGAQVGSLLSDVPRIIRAVLVSGLFLISTLSIMNHIESWRLAGRGARWMIYFFLLCIASAAWSSNLVISAWKGFEALTLALAIVSLAYHLKKEQDLKWLLDLMSACLLFLILTVIAGLILYPSEAIKNPDSMYTKAYFAVRGIVPIMNPATIGSLASLLLISALSTKLISKTHRTIKNDFGLWVVIGLAITDMLLGHSRTPIFACAIATAGMLFFANKTREMLLVSIIGAFLLIITSGIELILTYIYRGQTAESFTSLTGRLNFWQGHVYDLIASSPFFGQGYYAGFRESFNVGSLDNSYLAVTAGVGFIGVLIFITPVIHLMVSTYKSRPRENKITIKDGYWLLIFGSTISILIRSLTGTSFEVMHPLLIVYMILQISITAVIRLNNSTSEKPNNNGNESKEFESLENNRILEKKKPKVLHTTK